MRKKATTQREQHTTVGRTGHKSKGAVNALSLLRSTAVFRRGLSVWSSLAPFDGCAVLPLVLCTMLQIKCALDRGTHPAAEFDVADAAKVLSLMDDACVGLLHERGWQS